ncbi:aldehyde dehydrogenase family protein [Chitinophaga sedimenti]|uniref:aldehyde dehydrogenase family protein n=1 Tax=Chitinophaga sedimenti TaxID=2033606 RepID=UPI00249E7960|nr:aldehyde dehydrogenase family protein [Chitinophaga sedimenti]
MKTIHKIYINGQFVTPLGTDTFALINPTNNQQIGTVVLGNEADTQSAIAAAKAALPAFNRSTREQRIMYLQRIHEALAKRREELVNTMVLEYGGTLRFSRAAVGMAINNPLDTIQVLKHFEFERTVGQSRVRLEPVGVAGIITPGTAMPVLSPVSYLLPSLPVLPP